MKVNKVRNSIFLIITALIWGIAFVAQSEGGKAVGPYTFNCIRSFIGGAVLLPVIFLLGKMDNKERSENNEHSHNLDIEDRRGNHKKLITGGILCGLMLFLASTSQQLGMYYGVSAGKAGFLTACYILIVPIIGIFLKKKCGVNVWIGVFLALMGLYMLCMDGRLSIKFCDILVLQCAFLFSIHILIVDRFSPFVNGVKMSCIQFFVCGTLGIIPMFVVDMKHSLDGIRQLLPLLTSSEAWIPILYAGVLSCGVGYTLQILGQKGLNPTIASLLMSLESVFSVLAGWIILGETMKGKEILGCVFIFIAIILAQLPQKTKIVKKM